MCVGIPQNMTWNLKSSEEESKKKKKIDKRVFGKHNASGVVKVHEARRAVPTLHYRPTYLYSEKSARA